MSKTKDRVDFLVVLMGNCPERTFQQVLDTGRQIMWQAKTYHTLQERRGNYGLIEKEVRREAILEKTLPRLVQALNPEIKVKMGGDYRGYTTKLILPGGQYNTWGGAEDGWGVPV